MSVNYPKYNITQVGKIVIKKLKLEHLSLIGTFKSSTIELDNFLKDEAFRDQEEHLSSTYLYIVDDLLYGYFTLCNSGTNCILS